MVVCGQVLCLHQDLGASQQLFLKRSVCFYCTKNDCAPKPHRPSAVKVLLLVGLPQDQYSIWSFHRHCAHFLFCLFLSCQPFLIPETYLTPICCALWDSLFIVSKALWIFNPSNFLLSFSSVNLALPEDFGYPAAFWGYPLPATHFIYP